MTVSLTNKKSSLSEIEQRFENDVERFPNLETGQDSTIDTSLAMELITAAAIAATPTITRTLDIGCGAGNNTIKLLRSYHGDFDIDLNDLSNAMLECQRQPARHQKPLHRSHGRNHPHPTPCRICGTSHPEVAKEQAPLRMD